MDETRKIAELICTYSDYDTDESLASFLKEFDAFLKEMKIPQMKKQLIMNKEDAKPCMLNINS